MPKPRKPKDPYPSRAFPAVAYWPGATEFTDDGPTNNALWIVREARDNPVLAEAWEPVRQAAADLAGGPDWRPNPGSRPACRPRDPGRWDLIVLGFTMSKIVDVEPFYNAHCDGLEVGAPAAGIWAEAGFEKIPGERTTHDRLTELEQIADIIEAAAEELIGLAYDADSAVGRYVDFDGTAFETNARLEHYCRDAERCKAAGGRPPKFLHRSSEDDIHDGRHAESEMSVEEAEEIRKKGEARELRTGDPYDFLLDDPKLKSCRLVWINNHLWCSRDKTAGERQYGGGARTKKKFWHGGLQLYATCHYVLAPLAVDEIPAHEQEFKNSPRVMEKVIRARRGNAPKGMAADRGNCYREVIQWNAERGIGSAFPHRKPHKGLTRYALADDYVDCDGIPRCQHCHGPGDVTGSGLGFVIRDGVPQIRFRCRLRRAGAACDVEQSIRCEHEWLLLQPFNRLDLAYHALREAHNNSEKIHRHWRERYRVAGKDVNIRPKRIGMPWRMLRARVALFIEWARILIRQDWIAAAHGPRKLNAQPPGEHSGAERRLNLLKRRLRRGDDLCRGAVAVAKGFALPPPPE